MLSLTEKRQILCSFPELREVPISHGRYNYELRQVVAQRRIIAREFVASGNGYVLGTDAAAHAADDRGWINVKNFDESELRQTIRHAINTLRTADLKHGYAQLLTDGGLRLANRSLDTK